ncbi:hypothetical protein LCGC14_2835720 [marine sediment metagenome]|uniref:Uncharacterized protein n=1 Tax=marine sediment metagenome TaxID=412755 RepID=A0A0F8YCV7_9ZZZZ
MANSLDDQAQTRLALASLFVALVQTLGEQDKSFPSRFEKNVERIYREMEDYESEPIQTMETLRWAHELIRQKS